MPARRGGVGPGKDAFARFAELAVDFLDALGIVRLQPDEVVLRPHLMAHAVEL